MLMIVLQRNGKILTKLSNKWDQPFYSIPFSIQRTLKFPENYFKIISFIARLEIIYF